VFQVEIISDLEEPTIELTPVQNLDCDDESVSISITNFNANNQYSWTLPNSMSLTGQTIDASIPGNYTLSVFSQNGCSKDSIITVEAIGNLPVLSIMAEPIDCNNSITELIAVGSFTDLTWSTPAGPITDLMVDQEGWYFAFADNGNGCNVLDSVFVSVDTLTPSHQFENHFLNCDITTAVLTNVEDNDYNYIWTLPDGTQNNQDSLIVSQEGMYFVEILAANGCTAIDSVQIMNSAELPEFEYSISDTLSCINDEVTLQLIANDLESSNLTGPNFNVSNENEFVITEPGVYTLNLIGSNGCPVTTDIIIPIDTSIIQSPVELNHINCNEIGSLNIINPISDYLYEWQQEEEVSLSLDFETSSTDSILLVTTNPANGCSKTELFILEIDTLQPTVSSQVGFLTCLEQEQEINITPDGNYQYEWTLPAGDITNVQNQIARDTGTYDRWCSRSS